jgi:triphosphoribosyl-dephospho-CoA synthetase
MTTMADRDALIDTVAVALFVESDSERSAADFEQDLDWRDHRAFWRAQARAMLAVPEVAAALDLADQMRGAETVQEWGVCGGRRDGYVGLAVDEAHAIEFADTIRQGWLPVRRTVLRGPWETP